MSPKLPNRVIVAGVSGAGKTTLARRISAITGAPHVEIDALFHGPNWTPRPSFDADVDALVAQERWVTEWQYSSARERLSERAEVLVWLDLPFALTLWRVTRRTVTRRLRREELWNGNVEPHLWHSLTHPEGIIRWAVKTRGKYREQVPATLRAHPHLRLVRLRRRSDVDNWLRELAEAQR